MRKTKPTKTFIKSLEKKNIVILGKPKAGKTFVAGWLIKKLPNHKVIHTDDFNKMPVNEAIDKIIKLTQSFEFYIIEGNIGYRLLYAGAINQTFAPDVIINLIISDEKLNEYYTKRQNTLGLVKYFYEQDSDVLNKYLKTDNVAKQIFNIVNDDRVFLE